MPVFTPAGSGKAPGAAAGAATTWWGSWPDPASPGAAAEFPREGRFAAVAPRIPRGYPLEKCQAHRGGGGKGGFVQPPLRYDPAPTPNAPVSWRRKNQEALQNHRGTVCSAKVWATEQEQVLQSHESELKW